MVTASLLYLARIRTDVWRNLWERQSFRIVVQSFPLAYLGHNIVSRFGAQQILFLRLSQTRKRVAEHIIFRCIEEI